VLRVAISNRLIATDEMETPDQVIDHFVKFFTT
jgi:hypothetical protein